MRKSSSSEMVLTLISIISGINLFWECQNQLLINLFLLNIFLINVYNRFGSRTAATSKMERFVIIVKSLHLGCSPRSASVRYALWYDPVHKKWRNPEILIFYVVTKIKRTVPWWWFIWPWYTSDIFDKENPPFKSFFVELNL